MRRFQISHSTGFMRYGEIYASIRRYGLLPRRPRILVFGCSTGEEIRTVRSFWPDAAISACDIEAQVLEQASRDHPHADVFLSTDEKLGRSGEFDLVCCNSVLCRHPLPERDAIAAEFPFSEVESLIGKLVLRVRPEGYLLAYNMNHFMSDFEQGQRLQPISLARSWSNGFVPRLDREGRIAAFAEKTDGELSAFRFPPGRNKGRDIRLEDMLCPLYRKTLGRRAGYLRLEDTHDGFQPTSPSGFAFPEAPFNKYLPHRVVEEGMREGRVITLTRTYVKLPFGDCWHHIGAHADFALASFGA